MLTEGAVSHGGFGYRYRANIRRRDGCVLLLGGALQSMNSWNGYIARYEDSFDTIISDLPGMGESDVLPHAYPIEFLADCIKTLLDELSVEKVSIKAASYGTPIAYIFATKYPERVSRVILAGTMNRIPDDLIDDTMASVECFRKGDLEQAAAIFTRMFICLEHQDDIENSRLAQKLLLLGVRKISLSRRANYIENTLRLLGQPRLRHDEFPDVPCLVFTGEFDTYTTPVYCHEVARELPSAYFTLVEHADHLANLERFETVSELCYRFLRGERIQEVRGCAGYETFGAMA